MIYRVSYIYRVVGLGISEPSTVCLGLVRLHFAKFLHPKITDAASQVPTGVASARTFGGRSRSVVRVVVITRSTMKGRKTYIHVYDITKYESYVMCIYCAYYTYWFVMVCSSSF